MLDCQLIEAKTKDGLTLPGLHVAAARRRAAVIWVPGLGGVFTSHMARTKALAGALGRVGVGFAAFNTRGSYTVAQSKVKRGKITKRVLVGEAFEKFTDSVRDLEAMVHAVRSLGYKKVFLAGHSTGANKVAFFAARSRSKIAGGILLGPISDITSFRLQFGRRFLTLLNHARALVRRGRGGELLPLKLTDGMFWSANRFVSLAMPGQSEDQFPYYDSKRRFPWVKSWQVPVMVVQGSRDQFLDRLAKKHQRVFDKQCAELIDYEYCLVRGADHGFSKHHAELARYLSSWVRKHL